MVVSMVDDTVKQSDKLSVAGPTHTTLKYGQLKPLPIAVHEPENTTPALGVGNIVGNDIQMFVHWCHRVVKLG